MNFLGKKCHFSGVFMLLCLCVALMTMTLVRNDITYGHATYGDDVASYATCTCVARSGLDNFQELAMTSSTKAGTARNPTAANTFHTAHTAQFSRTAAPALQNSANKKRVNDVTARGHQSPLAAALRVLLVTRYRCGSSFIGELLKNNPSVFYSFEPLYFVADAGKAHPQAAYSEQAAYLEDLLFRCDTSALARDAKLYARTSHRRLSWVHHAFPGSNGFKSAQEKCALKTSTAAKVIRLHSLTDVIPRLTDAGAHVLYLVRDPRGTMMSRVKIRGRRSIMSAQFKRDVTYVCESYVKNAAFLRHLKNAGFNHTNKVVALRYEDFAYEPMRMATLLYQFLGTSLPATVQRYIRKSTNSTANGTYGVKRNSRATAEAWRKSLPSHAVKFIQSRCGEAMSAFGYKLVVSRSSDDDDESLVLPFPDDLPGLPAD